MKKRRTYHHPSAELAAPVDTGACSVSHSIAATLPAAMLRPLPQAPVGGKKHASLNPLGEVMTLSGHDLSLSRHSEITPLGCPFALLSASGEVMACSGHDISSPQQNERTPFGMFSRYAFGFVCDVRVGYFYKLYVRKKINK